MLKIPFPSSVSIFKENYLHQWVLWNWIRCHLTCVECDQTRFPELKWFLRWNIQMVAFFSSSSLIYSTTFEDDFCRNERWISCCCRNHCHKPINYATETFPVRRGLVISLSINLLDKHLRRIYLKNIYCEKADNISRILLCCRLQLSMIPSSYEGVYRRLPRLSVICSDWFHNTQIFSLNLFCF